MIKFIKSFFNKNKSPVLTPEKPLHIVPKENIEIIQLKSRMSISNFLRSTNMDRNYINTLVREQISKDIANQILSSPEFVEWISLNDYGDESIEANIKIVINKK